MDTVTTTGKTNRIQREKEKEELIEVKSSLHHAGVTLETTDTPTSLPPLLQNKLCVDFEGIWVGNASLILEPQTGNWSCEIERSCSVTPLNDEERL